MRGHQPLIEMRRAGVLPDQAAWVTDNEYPLDHWFARNWHGFDVQNGLKPCIAIDEADVIEALDFRCLHGLMVHLHAERCQERAKRLFSVIRKVKPKALICAQPTEIWFYQASEGGNGKRIRS